MLNRKMTMGMVGVLALVPCVALAGAPTCCSSGDNGFTGRSLTALGQPSPGVANVSLRPEYQAYVFTRNGVRYVELADAGGTPKAALTVVGDALLTLPIGHDLVQQIPLAPQAADLVYEDASMAIGVWRAADGSIVWQVFVK